MKFLLWILLLLAALSPLLTFARLWQIKEWRMDRLREHLRRDGWFSQLFGYVKPSVVVIGFIAFLVFGFMDAPPFVPIYVLYSTLGLLAWFTLFRFVVGKQAHPVWTKKAVAICSLSFLFLLIPGWFGAGIARSVPGAIMLMLLPLFSFIFVIASLTVLSPLDQFLKAQVLRKAQAIRDECPKLTVVGITGSVGKTMTKELLAHIVGDRKILVTPAHVNTEMGVADLMINSLTQEHAIFIVEMGAYTRGEIALLCSLTKPHIGAITFIGKQHLGLFGSQEELCKAKGELFSALPAGGHAFLNADSEFCEDLMKLASCPVHTVGTGGHATYEAYEIQEHPTGITFSMRDTAFSVPLQGTHHVTNVQIAIAIAETLGVPLVESAKRLQTFAAPAQTFEKKEGKKGQIVLDDTHNASPASFRAAIDWARRQEAEKKILVTSGLLELGEEERQIHQELGQLCREIFDEVVFLDKKCVQYFEQGYGKTVVIAPKKKFRVKLSENMVVVCEGRMPQKVVERLLT